MKLVTPRRPTGGLNACALPVPGATALDNAAWTASAAVAMRRTTSSGRETIATWFDATSTVGGRPRLTGRPRAIGPDAGRDWPQHSGAGLLNPGLLGVATQ